jgi:arginase family enzyme
MAKENQTLFFVQGNPKFEYADACLLGVEFDKNASYIKGTAKAPKAIIRASHQMDIEHPLTGKTFEKGIHNFGVLRPNTSQEMIKGTKDYAKKALEAGKFFILLGGDHSVVNGLLGALSQDVSFANFDAHLDLCEQWKGQKQSHAAVSRRIFENGFKQAWFGVRDVINEEEMLFVSEQKLAKKIFYCPSMPEAFYKGKRFPKWKKKENMLFGPEKKQASSFVRQIETKKVFLNIDADCLSPGEGIETGVPVPLGLRLEALNQALYEVCRKKQVLGLALTELIPDRFGKSQAIGAGICFNVLNWV